jgi:hypothetical protein
MNDSMMPEWMKKKVEQETREKHREGASRQRDVVAANLLQLKAPEYWQRLKEKLAIAVEFLPKLNMQGQITSSGDKGFRISVSRPGVFANQTFTDVFLAPRAVTCTGLNLGAYTLMFCVVSDTEIAVMLNGMGEPMNPDQASECIMRQMVELIELHLK